MPRLMSRKSSSKSVNFNFVSKMFNKPDYSDVIINIRGTRLYAHRFVICAQSPYFAKAIGSDAFFGGETAKLGFDEDNDSPGAHWRVFEYMYTGHYSDFLAELDSPDDCPLIRDVRVYALAEKFELILLRKLAVGKLKHQLKTEWQKLDLVQCISKVYHHTRSECAMRLMIAKFAAANGRSLQDNERFLDLLAEGGDFVVDFYKALQFQ